MKGGNDDNVSNTPIPICKTESGSYRRWSTGGVQCESNGHSFQHQNEQRAITAFVSNNRDTSSCREEPKRGSGTMRRRASYGMATTTDDDEW